jgi:hypothetical protein
MIGHYQDRSFFGNPFQVAVAYVNGDIEMCEGAVDKLQPGRNLLHLLVLPAQRLKTGQSLNGSLDQRESRLAKSTAQTNIQFKR